jgi:protein involved in polysaccharide export with SLBB domain
LHPQFCENILFMPKIKLVFTGFCILISSVLFAQQIPSLPNNLSNYRSSDVSNEQLTQIVSYIKQNNITGEQVQNLLLSRGMVSTEAAALRIRIERGLMEPSNTTPPSSQRDNRDNRNNRDNDQDQSSNRYSDTVNNTAKVKNPLKIFGLEIFNSGVISFAPNYRIATPVNYILGPDDEINITIFGYQEAKYNLTVSPEGDINIPYVGVVYVAGLTIEQASAKIRSKLASAGYSNIRTGLTKVNVVVGRIRSIKVTVLGEARVPGSFTLPSLATAFNALYLCGGPNEIGSMRKIEIIRGGKIISHLDVYDFLVKGDRTGDVNLRDQDVIRIPTYDVRISIEGQVKRTGLFEMMPGETFQDLLNFAGGFSDTAYTASVTAYKATDVEKRIIDIDKSQFSTYKPGRAESYVVKKLIERFTNRVSVAGAVYMPGDYELTPGMTLKDLLVKAQGLKENAYAQRGLILRQGSNLMPQYLSFNPLQVMQSTSGSTPLIRNDSVIVSSVSELRDSQFVSVTGEVRRNGNFRYAENMTLKDLVLVAGGFTDAAIPQRIEVGRRIKKDTFSVGDIQIAEVLDVNSGNDLETKAGDIKLQPYDAVIVRRNPGFQQQVNVRVEGEVVFPGPYVLQNKNERVSDVIKRAGGLTLQAYQQGVYISRINKKSIINEVNNQKLTKLQSQFRDTTVTVREEVNRLVDNIAINLNSILKNPGGKEDVLMEEGDVLTVPKEKMEVRISGEVLFPTRVVFENRMDLKDYISRAGGFTDNSRKARVYVLQPNGNAERTRHFLFFRSYPRVTPGSEIIVPRQREVERRRLSTGEVIGISTALTALGGVLIQLLK